MFLYFILLCSFVSVAFYNALRPKITHPVAFFSGVLAQMNFSCTKVSN